MPQSKAVNYPDCNPDAILRARPVVPPPELRPFFDRYAESILDLARGDLEHAGAVSLSASTAPPASDSCDTRIPPACAGGIRAGVSHATAPGGAHSSPVVPPVPTAASPQPSQRLPHPGRRRRFPPPRRRLSVASETLSPALTELLTELLRN